MLPRKDWRPENVVRATTLVMMSWMLSLVIGSVWAATRREQGADLPPLVLLVVAAAGFHGAGLAAVTWVVRSEHRTWRAAFGFDHAPERAALTAVVGLMVVAPAVYGLHAALAALMQWVGWEASPQSSIELLLQSGTGGRIAIAFFAVILAPIVEELLFRGLFFPLLRDAGLPRLAWFGTALLFGLIHANATAFVPLSLLGLFLTWLYQRTGNLLAPMTAHALFNLLPFVLLSLGVKLEA